MINREIVLSELRKIAESIVVLGDQAENHTLLGDLPESFIEDPKLREVVEWENEFSILVSGLTLTTTKLVAKVKQGDEKFGKKIPPVSDNYNDNQSNKQTIGINFITKKSWE